MLLDSVRSLKQELYEPLAGRNGLQPQLAPSVSVPAERAADVAAIQPGIALGVSLSMGPGDYRLAVRVQHPDLVDSRRLVAITAAARGEVDVAYIGRLSKQNQSTYRSRPLRMGGSIGHYAITAGTLGAFVRLDGEAQPRILSNNHVLADENRAVIGDAILQPGQLDGGAVGEDRVATLENFVALDPTRVNLVDAALAVVDEGIAIEGSASSTAKGSIAAPEDVERVVKHGRTTGVTTGLVTAIEVDNVVVNFSTGALRFDNQIEISGDGPSPFSRPGDSGSLIVDASTSRPAALLFAGSDRGGTNGRGVTYGNPLGVVFQRLSVAGLW